jgi:hypothetical protein
MVQATQFPRLVVARRSSLLEPILPGSSLALLPAIPGHLQPVIPAHKFHVMS